MIGRLFGLQALTAPLRSRLRQTRRAAAWLLVFAGTALAQQTVAPTTQEPVGPPRGENTGDYNVTQSFELGYRFALVGGDIGMYRSVDNYGNGIRLLSSSLTVNSKDGHGHYFDEILLTTMGLGNDPYQAVMLRVRKNQLYSYDMSWRLNDYYNPGLTVAGNTGLTLISPIPLVATGGLHAMDTTRRLQDHELTLLPLSKVRFRLGYSRNTDDGPALSTAQEFDPNGAAYPVFMNVRRQWNEYRLGGDADLHGFHLTVTRRWDFFKDDTPYRSVGIAAAGTPADLTVVNQFTRSEPTRGDNPGWMGNLYTRRKLWGINARLSYVSGSGDFVLNEAAFGTSQFGALGSRQIASGGDAKRPDLAGDFAVNWYPTDRLTIVNNSSITSNRIDGQSSYSEAQNGVDLGQTIYFRYLGIRLFTNSTDVNYAATDRIGFYGGYHYSDRLVRTIEGYTIPAFANSAASDMYHVSNHLSSGVAGVRLRPWKPFTVNLDGEIGRASDPLTPISDKNYHSLNGRAQYRQRRMQLSATYRQVYNLNAPFVFAAFDSHSRQYGGNASWTPRDWFALDASYTRLHLDTSGDLAFFASTGIRNQLQTAFASTYVSNVHAATLGARMALRKRIDLYVGYSINDDTGDGRAAQVPAGVTNPISALLDSVQTFPLTYQSPLARLSIRISPKVRWNAGWQFYDYSERFHLFGYNQNYRANTGFTSVLWSF